jgi:peptide subunit release factor 1 (eRF1)
MMSDFQKSFLGRSGMTVYTQKEFDEQLAIGKAEIMQIAIDTTKTAIAIEREECAKIVDEMRKGLDGVDVPMVLDVALERLADQIRNRLKK